MANVFISYASERRQEAQTLATALSDLQYAVWWDNSLVPADAYSDQIKKEIEAAKAVIAIWSPEAAQSLWVRSEATQAVQANALINTHVSGFDPAMTPRPFEQVHSVRVDDITAIVAALKRKKVPRGLRRHDPITEAALTGDALLPFLKTCSTDELDGLAQVILEAWHGDKLIEARLDKHPLYPEHCEYVGDIDRQYRLLAGHMVMNRMRGEGPPYRDILIDRCKSRKIEVGPDDSVVALEKKLVIRNFDDAYAKLTPAQQEEFRAEANAALKSAGSSLRLDGAMRAPAAALVMLAGANLSGFWTYKATTILANAFAKALVGHGLRLGANAALMRGLGLMLGPLGWGAFGLATAHQLAGPATIAVEKGALQIALLRQGKMYEDNPGNASA